MKGVPVPEPNIVERSAVVLNIERFNRGVCLKAPLLDAIDAERAPGRGDVVFNIRRLAAQPIWLHDKVSYIAGYQDHSDQIDGHRDRDGGNQRLLTRGRDDAGADFARWMP